MNRLPSLIGLAAAALLTVACGEQPTGLGTRNPPPPAFAILDGAHNGGNPGFFFLPPLVSSPSGDGEFGDSPFAASAAPRVEICELEGDPNLPVSIDCVGDALVTFSGSQITVSTSQFQVNWRTDQVELSPSAFYRIQVFVGAQLMGFADLDPVANSRELKRAKTGEVIPLVDGRTLPIRFTIEAEALCPTANPCTKARVTNEGGSFTLPSGTGGILLKPGWLPDGIGEVTLTLEDVALGPDNICHVPGAFTGLGLVAQFEGCMAITTEPALTSDPTTRCPELSPVCGIQQPAIIGLCIEIDDDEDSPIYRFLQLFKSDPGLPLLALEHADPTDIVGFSCEGYAGTPAPPPPVITLSSHSLLHYASSRLGNLTHRLARLLEAQPLYAVDLGEGGELPIGEFFSRFGWGVAPAAATSTVLSSTYPSGQLSVVGEPVFLEATVTPAPTGISPTAPGQVQFFDGETSLGFASLAPNGTASITVSSLSLAQHALTATFLGTPAFVTSTSPVFALHMVQRFNTLASYQAALGDVSEQVQTFDGLASGTPVSSIIAGVLNVTSPFPDLEASGCVSSLALVGFGNAEVDPRRQPTEGGFINSFYDLLFVSSRNALAFDIAAKDPASLPSVVEISGVGTTTARFDVSNTSDESTPVFVGMIASLPLARVIVHEGLEPGVIAIAEEMCLDNFRVATVGSP